MGVASRFEGGFTGGLDVGVEVGDKGVEVIWGHLAGVCEVLEGLLPVVFEFGICVVPGWGWGGDNVTGTK